MNICVGHSLQTVSLSLFRKMLSTQFSVRKWQGIWDACKCLLDGQYLLRFFWVKKQEQEDKNCIGRLKPHAPLGHSKRRVFLCLKTVCGFCFYFVCVWCFFVYILLFFLHSMACCFYLLWEFRAWNKSRRGRRTLGSPSNPLPCYVSQSWRALAWFCCSDGCCALQSVNCIKSLHSPALLLLLTLLAVFMNVTVKPIRGTTCLLICEPACLASEGTQLAAAGTVLISRKAVSEHWGLDIS